MEQRVYHGNISPDDLANYLVGMFNQGYSGTVAQKIGQAAELSERGSSMAVRQVPFKRYCAVYESR